MRVLELPNARSPSIRKQAQCTFLKKKRRVVMQHRSVPTGTRCTRTLGVAAATAAAAEDEQREAGGDDVEPAHLLPRRAPHLLQLPLRLPPLPRHGRRAVAASSFSFNSFAAPETLYTLGSSKGTELFTVRARCYVWSIRLQPDRSTRYGPRATAGCDDRLLPARACGATGLRHTAPQQWKCGDRFFLVHQGLFQNLFFLGSLIFSDDQAII
jgi:hypothetical protein